MAIKHPGKKGKAFELVISHKLAEAFGVDRDENFPRIPNSGGLKEKGDIRVAYGMREHFPFHLECKDYKKVAIWQFIDQAELDAPADLIPAVVVHRYKTSKDYIIIPLDRFLEFLARDWKE